VRNYADALKTPGVGPQSGDYVYIEKDSPSMPLEPVYESPYRVHMHIPRAVCVEKGPRQKWISMDCIKIHMGTGIVEPAAPAKRGRQALRAAGGTAA